MEKKEKVKQKQVRGSSAVYYIQISGRTDHLHFLHYASRLISNVVRVSLLFFFSTTLMLLSQTISRRLLPFTQSQLSKVSFFHSSSAQAMHIHPIPVRDDNYAYIVIDPSHPKKGVFVDPYNVKACQSAAKKLGIEEVVANITTHHHHDHSGGNQDFKKVYPSAKIYGGSDKIPGLTNPVKEGDSFPLFDDSSIIVTTRHTPCHTQDSTAFYLEDKNQSFTMDKDYARGVFTGDTLFISGCGRFFEGVIKLTKCHFVDDS